MDIEIIKKQISNLQRCVMNIEDARLKLKYQEHDDVIDWIRVVKNSEYDLIIHLKSMNNQNKELLK